MTQLLPNIINSQHDNDGVEQQQQQQFSGVVAVEREKDELN